MSFSLCYCHAFKQILTLICMHSNLKTCIVIVFLFCYRIVIIQYQLNGMHCMCPCFWCVLNIRLQLFQSIDLNFFTLIPYIFNLLVLFSNLVEYSETASKWSDLLHQWHQYFMGLKMNPHIIFKCIRKTFHFYVPFIDTLDLSYHLYHSWIYIQWPFMSFTSQTYS